METYLNENKILKDNVSKLRLNEWVSRDTVASAINNKDVVFIYYSGDETINRGYRTIEPFVLGVSTAGNLVVRAWQQNGSTDSGNPAQRPNDEIPGWRLFRLDGITSMSRTLRRFENPRPKYNPQDKQMTQIIVAANFGEQPQAVQPAALPTTGATGTTGTTGTTKTGFQGMTNDKSWFRNQYDRFKTGLFGDKQKEENPNAAANKNAANRWFGQRKNDFERIIKNQKNDNQNASRI